MNDRTPPPAAGDAAEIRDSLSIELIRRHLETEVIACQITPRELPVFSFIAALALSDAVQAQGVPARIKWPNDILIGGRKVGGTLASCALVGDAVDHVILGAGVLAAWRDRDALAGRRVAVRDGGVAYEGHALGVDAEGRLLVELAGGARREVVAGEVRLLGEAA